MEDITYAWENLLAAVDSLSSGTRSIQKRLYVACFNNLGLGLKPEVFPEEFRDDFLAIQETTDKTQSPAELFSKVR